MKIALCAAVTVIAAFSHSYGVPPVGEIIDRAIAAIERQDSLCGKYVNRATTRSIKYDKNMQPDEVLSMSKIIYHDGDRESELVLAIDKNGKPLSATEAAKRVRDKNEEWEEAQKNPDKKKKASRDNFVDPLTSEGRGQYSYFLVAERDSAISFDSAAVAGASDGEVFDQSVQRLRTYYVIQARPLDPDERLLNATYWIDGESAGVLRTVFAPSKMPGFVDTLHFEMDYLPQHLNGVTAYLPSRFEMKGKAGFLFFKGRFGVVEEFSEYRCDETIDEERFARRYWYEGQEEGR